MMRRVLKIIFSEKQLVIKTILNLEIIWGIMATMFR